MKIGSRKYSKREYYTEYPTKYAIALLILNPELIKQKIYDEAHKIYTTEKYYGQNKTKILKKSKGKFGW